MSEALQNISEYDSAANTRGWIAFAFLLFLILLIYSNTFQASWHLDDQPNILNNYYLHLNSLSPEKIVKTFFTDTRNPEQLNTRTYRPVACLSFATNWYFGQDNVVGYHIVNTAIHLLTAFFLYLFVLNLFNAPNLKNYSSGNPVFIALLSSILWAAHPIQTQAVTYIVQRMAQLAAFFYILGLFSYLKARLTNNPSRCVVWLACCLASYGLGVFSKPNAAMLPVAIVLVEIAFFQDLSDNRAKKKVFLVGAIVFGLVLLLGSALFLQGEPLSFLKLYDQRTFTLAERLLTQPRVIVFYLSQIFFPLPDRFSIAHDIVLSTSLLEPWTTIPSILVIFSLIGFAILQIKKRPLLALAILFFFLNHVIESSIIALELLFEHRNYLPSFFLFLPLACLLNYLLITLKTKNRRLYFITIVFCIFIVTFFSISTYLRNQVWKDDVTLWTDAMSNAPNDARASSIVAIKLAWGENSSHPNRFDLALKLLEESLYKQLPRAQVKADLYGNMALIYFHQKGDYQKAFECFNEALKIQPDNLKIRRDLVEALVIGRDFPSALDQVNILLLKNSLNGRYLNLKGHILLWQKKYPEALTCFNKAYPLLADKASFVLNSAVALSLSGEYAKAETLLLNAIRHFPNDMTLYFASIENALRAEESEQAVDQTEKMLNQFDIQDIKKGLELYTHNPKYAPLDSQPIWPILEKIAQKDADGN